MVFALRNLKKLIQVTRILKVILVGTITTTTPIYPLAPLKAQVNPGYLQLPVFPHISSDFLRSYLMEEMKYMGLKVEGNILEYDPSLYQYQKNDTSLIAKSKDVPHQLTFQLENNQARLIETIKVPTPSPSSNSGKQTPPLIARTWTFQNNVIKNVTLCKNEEGGYNFYCVSTTPKLCAEFQNSFGKNSEWKKKLSECDKSLDDMVLFLNKLRQAFSTETKSVFDQEGKVLKSSINKALNIGGFFKPTANIQNQLSIDSFHLYSFNAREAKEGIRLLIEMSDLCQKHIKWLSPPTQQNIQFQNSKTSSTLNEGAR
ncbi:MAG: hypothetical protein RMK80_01975 [Pseudobdellovibrionaceae bacterium]|nr:hypothetical protein [Pseudobdellovibrionaceae bacterium]